MTVPAQLALPDAAVPRPAVVPAASTARPWPVFFTASIAVFLVSLDSTVLFAAFGQLRQGFPAASAADLSWVLNAYTVVYAAMLVPAGRLADLHGRKRIFLLGVGLFLAASLACGFAPTVATLVIARVVQALGAALLTPASLALVLSAFPVQQRAVAVSLWGAVGGLAAALGPCLGAFLVDHLGWPWAFYLNLPAGLWSMWRARKALVESHNADTAAPLDGVGVLLLIAAVGTLTWGVVRSDVQGWHSAEVWGALAAGVALLALFVVWARRVPHPAIDLRLFESRTYRAVNLAMFTFGAAFAMMFFGFFFFMTEVWHYPLPLAGLAVTPGPLMVIPVAIVSGRFAARAGHRPLLLTGCGLLAAGGLWQLLVPTAQPQYLSHWLPGQLVVGIGVGMALPSLSGAAVAALPPHLFGVGSAVNQAVRQVGSVFGVAFTVLILGHGHLQLADFRPLFGLYATLALLAGALCLPVNTRPAVHRKEST